MPKLCDEGEHNILEVYLGGAARGGSANLYIGLYTDATEPAETANLATITELAVANGYARIALPDAGWTVTDDTAVQPEKTFTANGDDWGNVAGYFVCDAANGTAGNLIFVESFSDGPYNVLDGVSVKITPAIMAA
jgi:hypothetical protein